MIAYVSNPPPRPSPRGEGEVRIGHVMFSSPIGRGCRASEGGEGYGECVTLATITARPDRRSDARCGFNCVIAVWRIEVSAAGANAATSSISARRIAFDC